MDYRFRTFFLLLWVLRGRETGENSNSLFSHLSLTFSLTFLKKQKIKNRFGRAAEARAVYERAVEVLCASESDADGAAAARERTLQGGEEEKPSDGVIVVYEDDPETAAAKKSSASSSTSAVSNASRLYLAFAAFEAMAGEPKRARAIYRHALDKALKKDVETVFAAYSSFERSRGDREGVDAVVAAERRLQYEARVERDARDYDAWFEYARLEEGAASAELAEARASASSPESFNLGVVGGVREEAMVPLRLPVDLLRGLRGAGRGRLAASRLRLQGGARGASMGLLEVFRDRASEREKERTSKN